MEYNSAEGLVLQKEYIGIMNRRKIVAKYIAGTNYSKPHKPTGTLIVWTKKNYIVNDKEKIAEDYNRGLSTHSEYD